MSHFSVLVRVSGDVSEKELIGHGEDDNTSALTRALDPFCEHDDRGRLLQFMQFEDTEDSYRNDYENDTVEMVRLEDGSLVDTWDDRFRVPGELGFGTNTHNVPAHLEKVDVPYKKRFPTFEEYMTKWCEKERDPQHNRYGHYENPNARWDYWRIGGRWRGQLFTLSPKACGLGKIAFEFNYNSPGTPVPGNLTEVDWCRISNIDFRLANQKAQEETHKFWSEYDQFLSGHEFKIFNGPRETLVRLGILDCMDADEMSTEVFWKQKWSRQLRDGVDRFDVIKKKPDTEALKPLVEAFYNPLRARALLDKDGWHEAGKMGWWGMGSDTPDQLHAYLLGYFERLKSGDQNDWVVMVDCHI